MKTTTTIIFSFLLFFGAFAQNGIIKGVLVDDANDPVIYSNIALYNADKTLLIKVETSDEKGAFQFSNITPGTYSLNASYIGFADVDKTDLNVLENETLDLGSIAFAAKGIELETAIVTAQRAMVEVKPDKTVFNVEGTINSAGDNGLGLLRKAPGVLVDNNNNVVVLGRAGVLFYVDGKRLPLSGDDLTAYLENIPAEQIDRIDIITSPGAKYEAEGNAGIIDIILKKQKALGYNGRINTNYTQGRRTRANANVSGNYRNDKLNFFGSAGLFSAGRWNRMDFTNFQNELRLEESNVINNQGLTPSFRIGTDFFLNEKHTIGFIVTGSFSEEDSDISNEILLTQAITPTVIDSVLFSESMVNSVRDQNTYNLNYLFREKDMSINVDLDYGKYVNDAFFTQPNEYFSDLNRTTALSSETITMETPVDINIGTAKIDFEKEMFGGKVGLGSKYSDVRTENTFLFSNKINGDLVQNNLRSNQFDYSEKVVAGYLSYARKLSDKWSMTSGLRVEQTNSKGELMAFTPDLQQPPVEQNYINYFPSGGLTYQHKPNKVFSLNYGRRINRPDYNVLNPFRTQISELTFEKGNETLQPEIVSNVELSYLYNFRYNFKLAYSYTTDQITRLIGPDDSDPRASFISWDNLAEQKIYNFNVSAPFTVSPKWSMFVNAGASYIDNQADYTNEGGGIVDVQAFSYNIFQQSTFELGKGYKGEISGWWSGPGVWGGVFKYDESYSLNLGIQKKFNKLNIKISAQDITFQSGWSGVSEFNGLVGEGRGNWDSRTVGLSLGYDFGNTKLKGSRKRKTGIEEESKRVSSGDE